MANHEATKSKMLQMHIIKLILNKIESSRSWGAGDSLRPNLDYDYFHFICLAKWITISIFHILHLLFFRHYKVLPPINLDDFSEFSAIWDLIFKTPFFRLRIVCYRFIACSRVLLDKIRSSVLSSNRSVVNYRHW